MFMPVLFSCLTSGVCFFWGGIVTETKEECNRHLGIVMAHAAKDNEVKAYQGECVRIRFSLDEKRL